LLNQSQPGVKPETTGGNNTAVGYAADVYLNNLNNATAIGAFAFANASNKIRLGNDSVSVIEADLKRRLEALEGRLATVTSIQSSAGAVGPSR